MACTAGVIIIGTSQPELYENKGCYQIFALP
jgi:hypothetical protein